MLTLEPIPNNLQIPPQATLSTVNGLNNFFFLGNESYFFPTVQYKFCYINMAKLILF